MFSAGQSKRKMRGATNGNAKRTCKGKGKDNDTSKGKGKNKTGGKTQACGTAEKPALQPAVQCDACGAVACDHIALNLTAAEVRLLH